MAKISFGIDSDLPAETVLAVAGDFSDQRPHYWPSIDPKVYRVHTRSATEADVTEGSTILGGTWAREAYDLSAADVVRATVQESNVFQPGGTWELWATPRPQGGCHIEVLNHRQARGFKGHVLGALLTVVGKKALGKSLQETLDLIAADTPATSTSAAAETQPA